MHWPARTLISYSRIGARAICIFRDLPDLNISTIHSQKDKPRIHSLSLIKIVRAGSEHGVREEGLGRMSLKHTPEVSEKRALS